MEAGNRTICLLESVTINIDFGCVLDMVTVSYVELVVVCSRVQARMTDFPKSFLPGDWSFINLRWARVRPQP